MHVHQLEFSYNDMIFNTNISPKVTSPLLLDYYPTHWPTSVYRLMNSAWRLFNNYFLAIEFRILGHVRFFSFFIARMFGLATRKKDFFWQLSLF